MIAIGATSLGFGSTPLPEIFERLRELGGEILELNSQPRLHGGLLLDADGRRRARAWAASAGIAIRSIAGYNDFAQPDDGAIDAELARLKQACEIASDLEVGIVRAFAGEPKPGVGVKEAHRRVVAGFRRAAPVAERLGVTLALENHGRLMNDGLALAAVVEEVDSPALKLTLDSGNFSWAGHDLTQTRADFAAVIPHAVCVHVKDGVWTDDGFRFVPAGNGAVPIAELIHELASRGYDGPVYSEFEGAGEFSTGTQISVAYLRGVRDGTRPDPPSRLGPS